MDTMILAAGLGKRLLPLTEHCPKPLVPVMTRPLIYFSIDGLLRAGATRIAINAFYHAAAFAPALKRHGATNLRLVTEEALLGTAGGIHNALWASERATSDEVVVVNGDIFYTPDISAALAQHRASGAEATIFVRRMPMADKRATLVVEDQVLRSFGFKADADLSAPPGHLFCGVHILSRHVLAELPKQGCMVLDVYQKWLEQGRKVHVFIDSSPWYELGNVPDYCRAQFELLDSGFDPGAANVTVHDGCLFDSSVERGAGSTIERSILGARVRVAAGVRVANVIAWPDSVIDHNLNDAIITPQHVLATR